MPEPSDRVTPPITTSQTDTSHVTSDADHEQMRQEEAAGERFMRGVIIAMAITFVLGVIGLGIMMHLG